MHSKLGSFEAWLATPAGQFLLKEEAALLSATELPRSGQQLLIGSSLQKNLLPSAQLVSSFESKGGLIPEGAMLSLLPESQDVVLLPHTLELSLSPFVLLKKSLTLVKPAGYLVLMGFNSSGLWQLGKWVSQDLPENLHVQADGQLQAYLHSERFEVAEKGYGIYRWPRGEWATAKPSATEMLLAKALPFLGAVYILVMRKMQPAFYRASPAWRQLAPAEPKIKVMTRNS